MNPFVSGQMYYWISRPKLNHWLWTTVIVLGMALSIILIVMMTAIHGWMSDREQQLEDFAAFGVLP